METKPRKTGHLIHYELEEERDTSTVYWGLVWFGADGIEDSGYYFIDTSDLENQGKVFQINKRKKSQDHVVRETHLRDSTNKLNVVRWDSIYVEGKMTRIRSMDEQGTYTTHCDDDEHVVTCIPEFSVGDTSRKWIKQFWFHTQGRTDSTHVLDQENNLRLSEYFFWKQRDLATLRPIGKRRKPVQNVNPNKSYTALGQEAKRKSRFHVVNAQLGK